MPHGAELIAALLLQALLRPLLRFEGTLFVDFLRPFAGLREDIDAFRPNLDKPFGVKRCAGRVFVRLDFQYADIQRRNHWHMPCHDAERARDGLNADIDRFSAEKLPLRRDNHEVKGFCHDRSSPIAHAIDFFGCG
ncbi:hypothetical protein SDC9_163032 [bioreactor metagenome]|uniref:Uncharacterized protein n=1 Tax=bioreactor metagenome TaxID=1076179 RepID=A0A645FMQ4_9ZZZZ